MIRSNFLHGEIDDHKLLVSPILESPTPFLIKKGILRLIEPADANLRELIKQILAGRYAKPFVIDDARKRSLHFSLAHVQSAMRIEDPFALELAYTRKMMSFLLFLPDPKRILIIGLGGGSLAKYCHRHLPQTRITNVEINRDVIAFRDLFEIPPDDRRFRVVHADAVAYLSNDPANGAEPADTILLDGYDHHGITPGFYDKDFYLDLRRHLTEEGVLVANLSGERNAYQGHLVLMREVFENRILVLDVAGVKNKVAFAFNSDDFHRHFRMQSNDKLN
ncbi:MAG: spermidine synthase [Proteobacteria bacterium]|nr:spermidine synthase [Pseudomonadota bacterium]